jgi:hypothetical protein
LGLGIPLIRRILLTVTRLPTAITAATRPPTRIRMWHPSIRTGMATMVAFTAVIAVMVIAAATMGACADRTVVQFVAVAADIAVAVVVPAVVVKTNRVNVLISARAAEVDTLPDPCS